ncbi:hypothetical protein ZIOFF_009979 [Zingiber officinale]|uniref:Derlin n=1 Tax=Zingiber officinale TaxID=94328 RepID=A0A8J5I4M7_ZINOF|nr:hypothetical protein ZIOFF_009979 [Zingiber officinale]
MLYSVGLFSERFSVIYACWSMALYLLTSSKIFILKFKMLTTISQQQLKWLSLEPIIMHLIYHLLSASPSRFYKSLPPLSKSYGTLCFLTTAAVKLGLLGYGSIALEYHPVFTKFQVLSAIPFFRFRFLGTSMVFMLVYVWSREFRTAQINIYGLVSLRAFYLPWALLMLDVIFDDPLMPDLLGIFAGHVYYFLAVLHPLSTGRNLLKTPFWVYPFILTNLTRVIFNRAKLELAMSI